MSPQLWHLMPMLFNLIFVLQTQHCLFVPITCVIVGVAVASPAQGLQMKPCVLFLFRVRPEQVLWWLQFEQVMGVMSRLIVLVHPRHTGPGFTSTLPAPKRRCRVRCAPSAIERGEVGIEGVCSLRLPQRSLVDGLVGFECRHLAASRRTPRKGPNSCPTVVVVVVSVIDVVFIVAVFVD